MASTLAGLPDTVVTVVKASLRDQRRVAVICTGGTLCMKPNADGALAPAPGFLVERMLAMHEFRQVDMPACTLYELLPLLDSSDMGPTDWSRIADTIAALYDEFDGFVVIMGTDTMAYAASALSFMLESLGKAVIFTGSMLPLSVLFNDAHRNLIVSIVIAAALDIPEVCVFVDDQLLRGNRTVKSNSAGLDAFESPNFPALAKLETGIRFRSALVAPQPKGRFRVHHGMETNIAVWRMLPGFDDEYICMAFQHCVGLKAVVLELYGTGNLSSRKASLVAAIEAAIEKGIVIVAASQCLRGGVALGAYALGRQLESIGVLSAYDMTTEAVIAKLAYLLSWQEMTSATLRSYMGRSLRGEVTESYAQDDSSGAGAKAEVLWQAAAALPSAALAIDSLALPGAGLLQSLMRPLSNPNSEENEVRISVSQLLAGGPRLHAVPRHSDEASGSVVPPPLAGHARQMEASSGASVPTTWLSKASFGSPGAAGPIFDSPAAVGDSTAASLARAMDNLKMTVARSRLA